MRQLQNFIERLLVMSESPRISLKSARGNRSVAARLLGVSRRTLYNN